MDRELESLRINDVWDLVELPKDRKAVGSKWVVKLKMNADSSVERYKARLVAQGFNLLRSSELITMRHFVRLSVLNLFELSLH